jgi:hypothetical protein
MDLTIIAQTAFCLAEVIEIAMNAKGNEYSAKLLNLAVLKGF